MTGAVGGVRGGATERAGAAFVAWWRRLALVGGTISVVLGVILIAWPEATLLAVAVLVGLWLLLTGVVMLIRAAFIPEDRGASARVLQAVTGLALLVLGVACMRNLTTSLTLLALFIGLAWLLSGVAEIFSAFTGAHGWGRVGGLLLGLVAIVGAVVVLTWPEPSLRVIVWLVGIWFLAIGLVQLIMGWQVGRLVTRG